MKDIFIEQLVKRKPTLTDSLRKASYIVTMICIVFAFVVFLPFLLGILPLLIFAMFFLVLLLFRRHNIEYEYILTNSELDIDVIYGKSKRKRVFEGNIKNFEAFRPHGSSKFEHGFRQAQVKLDFSSGDVVHTHSFLCTYNGKKYNITFEPNSEILVAMRIFLKRGTYVLNDMK